MQITPSDEFFDLNGGHIWILPHFTIIICKKNYWERLEDIFPILEQCANLPLHYFCLRMLHKKTSYIINTTYFALYALIIIDINVYIFCDLSDFLW